MKQLIYETKKGTILFVKIEKSYSLAGLNDGHIYFWTSTLSQAMNDYPLCFEIPKGDFELIGLTIEVTEEQCFDIIDSGWYETHKDYNEDMLMCISALDSFKSLMQHLQVYEINPYERPYRTTQFGIQDLPDYVYADGDEAYEFGQSRTGKWVVLFKSNEKL